MELVTFDSKVYQELRSELSEIKSQLKKGTFNYPLPERWLLPEEVCTLLGISAKLLYRYRTRKILSYTQIEGKIFYKSSDVNELLNSFYNDKDNH